MTPFLIVVLIVLGAIALYVVSRRRYGVEQNGAIVITAIGSAVAILISVVAFAGGGGRDVAPIDTAAGPAAPLASAAPEVEVSPPAASTFPLADAKTLPLKAGAAQGGVDHAAFAPPKGGSYDVNKLALKVKPGTVATLAGWSANVAGRSTYGGVLLILDDQISATGIYHQDRLDVARLYQSPAIRYCGFQVAVPAAAPGHHVIKLGLVSPDGKSYQFVPMSIDFVVSS